MQVLTEKNDRNSKEVEITYIKDGEEITRKIPEYAAWISNIIYSVGSSSIIVAEDVELLHIKNLHFNENMWITCSNKDTILILEDCYFTEYAVFRKYVVFRKGNLSIINPQFIDTRYTGTELYIWDTEYIDLTLGKRNEDDREMHKLSIVNGKNVTISGDASNIRIESSSTEDNINSRTKLHLKNVKNFTFHQSISQELIIEDSTQIEFEEDTRYDRLDIINSIVKISCNKLGRRYHEGGSITYIKDSILEIANNIVIIGDHVYRSINGNERLLFLNNECNQNGNRVVAAANLISSLKAISRLATEEGNKGFTKIHARYGEKTTEIENEMKEYRLRRNYYSDSLKECQTKINEISEQEHIDCDKYQEEVNKKTIKSLVKR